MKQLASYLSGQWQPGDGEGSPLFNPTTGAALAHTSTRGLDLAGALAYARQTGGPALRALPLEERGAALTAISKLIHSHREELLAIATENGGNTRGDGKFDVDGASFTFAHYGRLAGKLDAAGLRVEDEVVKLDRGGRAVGHHVWHPRLGAAIHINAFNFPAWGFAEKAACAWLAGMPVLTKPATSSALLTFRLIELIVEAGILPAGALSLQCGSAGDLLDHVRPQDALAFTGSADTGARIRGHEAVIRASIPVNVEADSLNAAVLGGDVKVGGAVWHAFINNVVRDLSQKAGQKCTAIRRVLVPENLLAAVREELSERISALRVGDPAIKGVEVGPLASAGQLRDGRAGVERLAAAGEILVGGVEPVSGFPDGCFLRPTLLAVADGSADGPVHAHEVFGPVATLLPYDGSAAAVSHIIGLGQGSLMSSFYSNDRAWSAEVIEGCAPWLGRMSLVSKRVAELLPPPGTVLPSLVHGGPGRAGGGEELGGVRGVRFYQQRTALQGDGPLLSRLLGLR